jgi:phosphoserine phosphatase
MPVLVATLVVDSAKARLSDARADEIVQGVAGFERTRAGCRADGLERHRRLCELPLAASLAVGDGANEVAMLEAAGSASPAAPSPGSPLRHARVAHGGFTVLLFGRGIAQEVFVGG